MSSSAKSPKNPSTNSGGGHIAAAAKTEPYLKMFSKLNFRSFHGAGGLAYLLVGLKCVAHLLATRAPHPGLDGVFLLLQIPLFAGLSAKQFRSRLRKGKLRDFFLRIALWTVAFSGLNLSVYTMPATFWASPSLGTIGFDYLAGTACYVIGTLWSLGMVARDLYKGRIVKGSLAAFISTYVILFLAPVRHLLHGTPVLAEAYKNHRFGESLYAVSVCSAWFNSYDALFVGLVTSGHISPERHYKTSTITWAVLYAFSVAILVGYLQESAAVGVQTYLALCVIWGLGTVVDKRILRRGSGLFDYEEYKKK